MVTVETGHLVMVHTGTMGHFPLSWTVTSVESDGRFYSLVTGHILFILSGQALDRVNQTCAGGGSVDMWSPGHHRCPLVSTGHNISPGTAGDSS